MTADTAPATRAGPREWVGLAILTLPALLVSMDLTVLHLAVPQISADLAPSGQQLLWIVDIYGFLIAGFLITMGTLGDRVGRRRLLLIGAAAFGVASLFAAFSTSAGMLIASRAVLGVAGATLAPSTLALIRNMFHDADERARAISLWFVGFLAGAALGPLVGGALLELFWWGSVFLIGVPVMALLLLAGPAVLPEYRGAGGGRLDPASVAMSLGAVLAVVYGLKQLAIHGPLTTGGLAVVLGAALGLAFLRRQRRLAEPLLDLGLFAGRAFGVSLAVLTVATFVMAGVQFLVAQYLQLEVGLSALDAGLWLVPPLAVGITSMMLAPKLLRLFRPGALIGCSLLVAAAGFALVSQAGGDEGLAAVVIGLTVAFAGLMPASALGLNAVVAAAPPDRAGAASAISETTQEVGGALGIAVIGSICTAVYRVRMADAVPADVPPGAARAAGDTLSGAHGVSAELPATVLVAAGDAFGDGIRLTALLCSVVLVATAATAAVVLREPSLD